MPLRKIYIYGHPVLRMKAHAIDEITPEVRELAEDMIETMRAADGIGLAGPQVGEKRCIVVVDMDLIEEGEEPKVFINPEILSDNGSNVIEEGCLSIPDIRENVDRPEFIKVKYLDIDGEEHVEECSGMLARVLQHEIDHLHGVLFIDRISSIKRSLLAKKLKKLATGA